jgi:hypothetical protein
VGCQVFDSIKAEEHADLGTDLWILTVNTARVVHEESRPSGIVALDKATKMSEKSVANLGKIGGKSVKEIGENLVEWERLRYHIVTRLLRRIVLTG